MMNRMIVGNLVHRPLRSLISVVAIALEVTMILLIVGLSLGMLQDSRARTAGIGADVLVLPPGSSFIAGLTGAPMPIKIGDVLAKLPHVTRVAPVVTQISSVGSLEIIAGIDLHSYETLSAGFHYLEGGPFQGPFDVMVDDLSARSKHVKVGDTIEILNNKFRVCGVVERGKGARKFIPLSTMQDLIGAKDKATIFYLKLDDPANADAVVDEIKHVPGNRHSEVNGGVQALHCQRGAQGNRAAGHGRNRARYCREPGGSRGLGPEIPAAAGGGGRGLDRARDPDCDRRGDCRRTLSGVQSGSKGSHRRPSLRIAEKISVSFAFISPAGRRFNSQIIFLHNFPRKSA